MFFFRKKQDNKNSGIKAFCHAAEELRQGKQNYLPVLYQALVAEDKETIRFVAREIAQYMQSLNAGQIIRLDEQFRTYTSLEWRISWEKVDVDLLEKNIRNKEDFLWCMRVGTFHPNGFFREKCIRKLATDWESAGFLLLRLNDWAAPVRTVAEEVCSALLVTNDKGVISYLPYLQRVAKGLRRNSQVLATLEERVAKKLQEQIRQGVTLYLKRYEVRTRLYLYRLLYEHECLEQDDIGRLLEQERNGQCQYVLMTILLSRFNVSMEELDIYLNHKSKMVQRVALERKYSVVGTYWDGLEHMLLSTSAGIREMVSYILRKHTEIDVLSFYKARLETTQRKICILGIGENGAAGDVKELFRYLNDVDEGVVKCTLWSISKVLGRDAEDIYWQYLQDARPVVMRAAYQCISKNEITYGAKPVFELFLSTDSQLLREKLAYQTRREKSWDCLPYALKLYWYEDEHIRDVLRGGIIWRSMYATVSEEEAEQIRAILHDETYRIPEELQKKIEFDLRFVVKGKKSR